MVSLIFRGALSLSLIFSLCGCSVGYLVKNAYHQSRLLQSAVPVEKLLQDPKIDETTKNKLLLATEAKNFAEGPLKLKKTKNYSTFAQLDGPYVTYIVSAAPKNELKYYTWYFPIVGTVPYKGYFVKEGAVDEASDLEKDGLDVYVRGVTAFSTLGWFTDPILSSMLAYTDYDLVNTIIHETVHSTLYLKGGANFNERLANYLGDLGAQLYYESKGAAAPIMETVKKENADQKLFGQYISAKIKNLENWYKENKDSPTVLKDREAQFENIKKDFQAEILPKLQTEKFKKFHEGKINNARLLGYKLYMNDLEDFEKLTVIFNKDFDKIIAYCKSLEGEKDPEKALKEFIAKH